MEVQGEDALLSPKEFVGRGGAGPFRCVCQWRIRGGGGLGGLTPPLFFFFFFACQYMKIPRSAPGLCCVQIVSDHSPIAEVQLALASAGISLGPWLLLRR